MTFHRNGQTPKEYESCHAKFGNFYPCIYMYIHSAQIENRIWTLVIIIFIKTPVCTLYRNKNILKYMRFFTKFHEKLTRFYQLKMKFHRDFFILLYFYITIRKFFFFFFLNIHLNELILRLVKMP